MPKPVLLVVDEDQVVLEGVAAQLGQRYAGDYQVQTLGDAELGLRMLAEIASGGEEVALVLAGKSLLDASGAELFDRTRQLHPHAKRALVVPAAAWADQASAEAILDLMALGRIDYYVPRPVGSPDEVFHQAISGFLLEWATERRMVPHTVHIVGESWAGRAAELRQVFEQCAMPHDFHLADSEPGRKLLSQAGPEAKLPLMVLPSGLALGDPSDAEIAQAAGAPADLEEQDFDLVIVGAGPAGLSAAVYGASEGLRTLVVDKGGIGGQARSSSLIRNYLGFPSGVSGNRLAEQAYEQASVFGASFVLMHPASALSRSGSRLEISVSDERRVSGRAVILASGASYRRLGAPSLEELNGAGVFYGATASAAHGLSGKDAYIAGGGNSAGQAALHLARYARRVTLVVRAASLEAGMSHYLVRQVQATPNVEVRAGTTVVGGGGDGRLQELVLRDAATGDEIKVEADALFVLIGARPHTGWLPQEIARDASGFLFTGDDVPEDVWSLERRPFALETSMPGVLAVGDVRHASVKRVASAVGEGSIAVQIVHNLLAEQPPQPGRPTRADAPAARASAHPVEGL